MDELMLLIVYVNKRDEIIYAVHKAFISSYAALDVRHIISCGYTRTLDRGDQVNLCEEMFTSARLQRE